MKVRSIQILAILTGIAFGLRVIGATSSIMYIPDTQIIHEGIDIGQALAPHDRLDVNPGSNRFKYPLTLPLYTLVMFGSVFVGGVVTRQFSGVQAFIDYLFTYRAQMYVLAVYGFNLINVLLVPGLFVASRRLNKQHTGWLAAGLVTGNLMLVQFSHQPRPHATLAALAFIAVLMLVNVAYGGRWYWAVAATVVSALAVGTVQSGILVAVPFGLAWLARCYDGQRFQWKRLYSKLFVGNMVLFVGLVGILYPSILGDYLTLAAHTFFGSNNLSIGGGQIIEREVLRFYGLDNFRSFVGSLFGYQPLLTVLAPLALAYFVWRFRHKPRLLLVTLPFPLLNILFWGLFAVGYPRYFSILPPFLIAGAAFLLEDMILLGAERFHQPPARIRAIVMTIVLVPLAVFSSRLVYVLAQSDTRTLASAWVESNVPADSVILTNGETPDLQPDTQGLQHQSTEFPGSLGTYEQWILTHPGSGYTLNLVNMLMYDNVPIERLIGQENVGYAMITTLSNAIAEQPPAINYLLSNARLLNTFCPGSAMEYTSLPEDIGDSAWTEIWRVNKPGPIVLVFQMSNAPLNPPTTTLCGTPGAN